MSDTAGEAAVRADPGGEQAILERMLSWRSGTEEADRFVAQYVRKNLRRFARTLAAIPRAPRPDSRLLDIGGLLNLVPCYQDLLGYSAVTMSTRDEDSPFVPDRGGVDVVRFDAEFDRYPFPDESFDTVVSLEVIEHLTMDPMRMMAEINRVCRPGGSLVMTTPNVVAWKALARVVQGKHPSGWSYYSGYHSSRHNREYTPAEMAAMVEDAGFDVAELTTFSQSGLERAHRWLRYCLVPLRRFWELPPERVRGDYILVRGVKAGGVRRRLPQWLYGGYAQDRELLRSQGRYQGPEEQ
jgi:SAM-dependent methyltransferase